jgi:FMN phosphatase YigB (HAD superfamily)
MSLDLMGTNPEHTAFAEDRDYNLNIPYDLGLTTVLIDHPSQSRDLPPHVHYRYNRAADFMNTIRQNIKKSA